MATKSPKRFEPDKNGNVQLRYGDVSYLAERTGKSSSHVGRVIADPRGRAASDTLIIELLNILGVSALAKVRLPQRARRTKNG